MEIRDVIQMVLGALALGGAWQTVKYLRKTLDEMKLTQANLVKLGANHETRITVIEDRTKRKSKG